MVNGVFSGGEEIEKRIWDSGAERDVMGWENIKVESEDIGDFTQVVTMILFFQK